MNIFSGEIRIKLVGGAFVLLAVMIAGMIVRIQNTDVMLTLSENLEETYNSNNVRVIEPERGYIYDRWGNLLAGNEEVYEVGFSPIEIYNQGNPETVAQDLSGILGLDYNEILTKAKSFETTGNTNYEVIQDFVSPDKIAQLEQKITEYSNAEKPKKGLAPTLNGVHWNPHLIRRYPENDLAANILGYFKWYDRQDSEGVFGLEEQYNSLLSGTAEKIFIPMNPSEIQDIPDVAPGASLILTIDREVQASMQEIAKKAVADNDAESATIIVMQPETGEILAMATTPEFNPNEYWKFGEVFNSATEFDRAISQVYEPGSVFKVLTMAAALDSGAVTPETTFTDTGVYAKWGIPIYNWDRGAWGVQDMTGCMQHSLNVCLAWVADQMGTTTFYQYIDAFGIGKYTGVDLSGEQVYPLAKPGDPNWYPINLGTNSFGQGVAATPIEMITAINAVANNGKMMVPHLVRAYIKDGVQYNIEPRQIRRVIKLETAQTLTNMLANSLEDEASSALVEGYRVAGKTGTGEIPTDTGYETGLTNTSFVGWGPVDDPQFIVYIWIEKPQSSIWGSEVAAPVFAEVVKQLVVDLQIPPDSVRLQASN
jgi:cell division protein FtsI/penicillin-binding protein 2